MDILKKAVKAVIIHWKRFIVARNKLIEKVPHPRNAQTHNESILRKKNRKSEKQSEIITYPQKAFDAVDIK